MEELFRQSDLDHDSFVSEKDFLAILDRMWRRLFSLHPSLSLSTVPRVGSHLLLFCGTALWEIHHVLGEETPIRKPSKAEAKFVFHREGVSGSYVVLPVDLPVSALVFHSSSYVHVFFCWIAEFDRNEDGFLQWDEFLPMLQELYTRAAMATDIAESTRQWVMNHVSFSPHSLVMAVF